MSLRWDKEKISVIHCFGDSLTAGYGVPLGQGWVELLEKRMKILSFYNHGQCGAYTDEILADLSCAAARAKPEESFFFMGGINDILSAVRLSVLEKRVEDGIYFLSKKVPITLGIPFAVTRRSVETGWQASWAFEKNQEDIREYACFMRKMAENMGLLCIDFSHAFPPDDAWYSDGIHPNKRGYEKMAEAAMNVWA